MKFSAIVAISTLAISVSSLPLEMAYRSRSSYYQARDVLPSGQAYPRAAAPEPMATAIADVPPVFPALTEDDNDENNPAATEVYNNNNRRLSARQRREAIRARSPAPVVYEREAEPEAEPEASPEAEAEPVEEDEDILLDEKSRAALLRRLIAAEEEAAEKKADEYIRSFRFHRRAVDYASY